MFFQVRNAAGQATHAALLEFTAAEGFVEQVDVVSYSGRVIVPAGRKGARGVTTHGRSNDVVPEARQIGGEVAEGVVGVGEAVQ
jgi:hypothetical protein